MGSVQRNNSSNMLPYGSHSSGTGLMDEYASIGSFGEKVRVSRRWVLSLVLLLWGAHGLSRSIVVLPGCPYDEVQAVCGSGKGGQNAVTSTVSMTSCAQSELALAPLLSVLQVGFGTNTQPNGQCLLFGCEASQCLKTTSECHSILPDVTYECVDSQNVADIQPLEAVCYTGLFITGLIILFARRPVDPSNAQILGILLVSFALYNLMSNIRIYSSCDWSDVTYDQCPSPGTTMNLTETVSVQSCSAYAFLSPFATNVPKASPQPNNNNCQLYGCDSTSCLRTTHDCATGKYTNECAAPLASSTADPGVVFCEAFVLVVGLALLWKRKTLIGWRRLIAICMIVWGIHNLGHNMTFVKSCDWDSQTADTCGSGTHGQVRNEAIVQLTECFQGEALTPWSPFAVNVEPTVECLQYACGTSQCLRKSIPCVDGVPQYDQVSHECDAQLGIGLAAPVALVFHAFIVVVGLALLVRWRASVAVEGDAHCMHCF